MVTGWILPYNLRPFLECLLALLEVPWHDLSWETTRANVALTDFDAEHWYDVAFTGSRPGTAGFALERSSGRLYLLLRSDDLTEARVGVLLHVAQRYVLTNPEEIDAWQSPSTSE